MEISLASVAPPQQAAWSWARGGGLSGHAVVPVERRRRRSFGVVRAEANGGGGEAVEGGERERIGGGGGYRVPTMEVTTFNQRYNDADFSVWEKIGAIVRLGYGIAVGLHSRTSFLISAGEKHYAEVFTLFQSA